MAYEPPADTSDPKRFPIVARGVKEWSEYINFKRGFVRIDPELRKFFKNDEQINEVLRHAKNLIEAKSVKQRKSA